jgi:hypothetical protein
MGIFCFIRDSVRYAVLVALLDTWEERVSDVPLELVGAVVGPDFDALDAPGVMEAAEPITVISMVRGRVGPR